MNLRQFFFSVFLAGFLALTPSGLAEAEPPLTRDTSWTFTHLKANAGNKELLRQIIVENWFAMDAIAVRQKLFKDYRLIENVTEPSASEDIAWDFIVAVEYFGDQSYLDISEPFEEIRSKHQIVLIEGKAFSELGRVVRSERVVVH